jgi:hypothetical protein
MAVGISSVNTAHAWLNVFRGGGNGVTFTAPATLFVQLHTADPGSAGTTAISVGSTVRQTITWAAAASNATGAVTVGAAWTNGGTNETLTHISIHSLSAAGTFYWSAALTVPKAWASADTFTLLTCSLTLTPIAA